MTSPTSRQRRTATVARMTDRMEATPFKPALTLLVLALLPAAAAAAAPRPPAATIEEIPPPTLCATSGVRGLDISATGAVVGYSGCNPIEPFRWSQGVTTPLDTVAHAINGAGQIASNSFPVNGETTAFRDGVALATPASAAAIDEAGTVAGSLGPPAAPAPVLWRPDGSATLLALGGAVDGSAYGISDDGDTAVGRAGTAAARWTPALQVLRPLWQPTDLERAYAVNDAGDAVGVSRTADGYNHAVLWRAGSASPVRLIAKGKVYMSSANGIDNLGRVVGSGNSPRSRAFVWTPARGHVDLNTLVSGWTLTVATAINDAGQITGAGLNPAGLPRAFRLTLPAGF